jgi:uncharacterized protein (DUF427 family)
MSDQRGRVRLEPGLKRVRAHFGGEVVLDTIQPWLVWENPHYPAYYIPADDVARDHLVATDTVTHSPSRGDAHHFTVTAGGKEAVDAAWTYPESPLEGLRGLIRFEWQALDAWFEEDEEVFVHPRDPYKRVDVLASSRHVQVAVNGVTIADTHRPTLLFESNLPIRYYVPKSDVRMDLLAPTDHSTACPYKGFARYWAVQAGEETIHNLAWSYATPLPESIKVAGLVCFYNEHADITVDGVAQERPKTPFS